MRTILHTIDTTGPGGAETVFIDLATGTAEQGYRSLVLIRGAGWVAEELRRRGHEPRFIDAKGSFNWRYLKGLVRLIRREKVDLIQSHLLGSNVYCAMAGLLTRVPVVATFHGSVDIGQNERLKGIKFGAINRGAKRVVAVSDGLRDGLITSTPLKAEKITVIYNGIRTTDFQRDRSDSLRRHNGWGPDDWIIGSLGNIRDAKGYDILLRAAAALKERSGNYRFVIAGQGKPGLYDELLRLRAELGVEEHVKFLGFNDDPAGFLANLDVFLMSSTSEGLPLAMIQATAARLPVLATRCGGPEEIITHGDNGWLVESGSPEAIASGLEKLVSEPALMANLAKKGSSHAQDLFSTEAMLKSYEDIYDACLSR